MKEFVPTKTPPEFNLQSRPLLVRASKERHNFLGAADRCRVSATSRQPHFDCMIKVLLLRASALAWDML